MKKLFVPICVTVLALSFAGLAHAQTSVLQKAVDNAKDQLDGLVTAKDTGSPQTLALRIETFGKVIELSLAEAKDLRVKLLAEDNLGDEMKTWKDAMVDRISSAIEHFDKDKQNFEDNGKSFDLTALKDTAQAFKDWRDTNYLPYANQVRDFFLARGEGNAIQVATKRLQKISDDVRKLERARVKNVNQLSALLKKASNLVKESENIDKNVQNRFLEMYVYPLTVSSTATSTGETTSASTTEMTSAERTTAPLPTASSETSSTGVTATSTATSSIPTGNASDESPTQPPSIKDLVSTSLTKVRGAYQVFIEMSNLVRELLK